MIRLSLVISCSRYNVVYANDLIKKGKTNVILLKTDALLIFRHTKNMKLNEDVLLLMTNPFEHVSLFF